MGLNDREYARDPDSGYQLSGPRSVVGGLILLNVLLYVIDVVSDGRLSDRLDLTARLPSEPWKVWELVTYGFLHDYRDLFHILGNMLMLFFFGRELEEMYGKWEFLRLYLTAIVLGGVAFVVWRAFVMHEPNSALVGASAAVATVLVLYALHFPRRQVYIWGVLPVPVWVIAGLLVVSNLFGMLGSRRGDPVAYEAHVAGILLALAYHRFQWNFGAMLPRGDGRRMRSWRFGPRPKLKVHAPADESAPVNLSAETDRILAKIHATGYDSLTADERRTLERASARARAHKRGP